MLKKGNLFSLIKSLTKPEKRYFRLFAARGSANKNYLLLFDFIAKQAECDDPAIKAHFKDMPFTKQLHVTKIYLNNLILKSLRNFHGKISKSAELKDLLRDIEILFRKELFDQCLLTIEKALILAQKYEKQTDLLEICAWKRKILLEKTGAEKSKDFINETLQLEKQTLKQVQNLTEYWDLTINLFDVFAKSAGKDLIGANPLLKNIESADSVQSRVLYHHILYAYNTMKDNPGDAEKQISDLITFLESHPESIKEDPSSYITALNNKIAFCLHMKQLELIPDLLTKVKAIPQTFGLKEQNPMTIKLLLRTYNVELELYRDSGQYEKGVALAQEVKEFLDKYKKSTPADYQLLLYYQFAYLYFMQEDYRNTLFWLNEIFRKNFGKVREDIQSFAHLLGLIVQFELGNVMVLKYAVDSCRRFLKKKRQLYHYEKVLLRFFSKLSMATPDKYRDLFKRLEAEIFSETSPEVMENTLDYLNFKRWIEKKVGVILSH